MHFKHIRTYHICLEIYDVTEHIQKLLKSRKILIKYGITFEDIDGCCYGVAPNGFNVILTV